MEFYETIETCLSSSDYSRFRSVFYAPENESSRNEMSWDLAVLFMTRLGQISNDDEEEARLCLEEANLDLSRRSGSPKELFMIYAQNGEYFTRTEANLVYFYDLVENLFVRAPNPKFVIGSLNEVVAFANRYAMKKNVSSSTSISVQKRFVELIDSLAQRANTSSSWRTHVNRSDLHRLLSIALINNLSDLLTLKTNSSNNSTTNNNTDQSDLLSLVVANVCSLIRRINADVFRLLVDLLELNDNNNNNKNDDDDNSDENTVHISIRLNNYSLWLYGCILASADHYAYLPCVYDKFYIFLTLLAPINNLLNEETSSSLTRKSPSSTIKLALDTLESLLTRQEEQLMGAAILLELDAVGECVELLFRVSLYASESSRRRAASTLLKSLFAKFDRTGRFEFLRTFLSRHLAREDPATAVAQTSAAQDFICSFLIYLFKEEINECFLKQDRFYFNASRYFTILFNMLFNSNNKHSASDAQTLIRNSTRIIAELNLLRLVMLKDKLTNHTQIYTQLKPTSYLSWLKDECRLGRLAHEHELNELKQQSDGTQKQQQQQHQSVQVTINDREIREPSRNEQIQAVTASLQTLDLIECLRVRVDEILNEYIG